MNPEFLMLVTLLEELFAAYVRANARQNAALEETKGHVLKNFEIKASVMKIDDETKQVTLGLLDRFFEIVKISSQEQVERKTSEQKNSH